MTMKIFRLIVALEKWCGKSNTIINLNITINISINRKIAGGVALLTGWI